MLREPPVELLRLSTAGSVDDGKSTLIGRLLHDSKSIFEDQLEAVQDFSRRRGDERPDLALLTDGLRAEREQGITIDVAYRYFATPRRRFILADTPGHVQYTRNMVTGASTANLAIVLVDARQGVLEQTRRHAYIASLLRIPHLVMAVNKMDLVGHDEATFRRIESEMRELATRLDVQDVTFIPISALHGDNIVDRSANMPWYSGPTLLHHLEHVHIASDRNMQDVRFPVQWVIRPQSDRFADYRGYAGQVAGGVMRPGDEVVVLPSGLETRIARIEEIGPDGLPRAIDEAYPPMSVTVHLADDLDVSRGDMICRPGNRPTVSQAFDARVCWLGERPLQPRTRYAIKHTTRNARAMVESIAYRLDIQTGHRDTSAQQLAANDIGRITVRTTAPIMHDPYHRSRTTGAFILVDESTNATVAAGMIVGEG
ncbi:MAG: sulfate adenylyltransferase subunit 1 [Phycisphaerales bacterium]